MLSTAKRFGRANHKVKSATKQNAQKGNTPKGAIIWGILSDDDSKAGFELILDNEDQLFLLKQGKTLAHFDPFYYTVKGLTSEIMMHVQKARSKTFWAMIMTTTAPARPSWFDKLHLRNGKALRHDKSY